MSDGLPRQRARRSTIVDVARAAGVSIASASKVVRGAGGSPEMYEKVTRAVSELGYRPHRLAQGLRGPIKTIGVLLTDLENPFFNLLINGASEVFEDAGFELFLSPAGTDEASHRAVMESLIDHSMVALLLIAPRGSNADLDSFAREVPIVMLGRHGRGDALDSVSSDDRAGSRLVVDHLADQGHERIAFLANTSGPEPDLPENVRLAGYREAMIARGLDPDRDVVPADWSLEGGRAGGQLLLADRDRPSAVHGGADVAALGVLTEMWDRGLRAPDDLAVVGYDDSPTARLAPVSLSSVDQSGFEMGRRGATLLLERLDGRTTSMHEMTTPALMVRSTSAGVARS